MKVFAICHRRAEYAPSDFAPHMEAEALQALRLFAAGGVELLAALSCLNAGEPGMEILEALVRRELMGWL